jgi:Domain of unknown function (DUF4129)
MRLPAVHRHVTSPVLRAGVVIAIGLLLALGATVGPLMPAAGEPGASLSVRLPDAVKAIVLTLLALSAVLFLTLQRRRRRTEDEMLPLRTDQRRPAWASIVSLLPLVLLLAAAWYFAWNGWPAEDGHPVDRAFAAIAGLLELFALARKPPISVPFFDLTIAGLLVAFALALFALMIVVALAPRLEQWWSGRTDASPAPPLDTDRADTDGDPRAEPDPRTAIIRAYGRFERALAAAHAPRLPCQTPREFMRTTLAQMPVPVSPVARLTALFETARFSDRPIGTDARDVACDSLDEITRALADRR